jgi:hypothetical protein
MEEYTAPLENGKENHEIDFVEWVSIKESLMRRTNSITKKSLTRLARRIGVKIGVKIETKNINSFGNLDNILEYSYLNNGINIDEEEKNNRKITK